MLAHFKEMGWDGKSDIWWTMKTQMYGLSVTSPWGDAVNNEWAHEHIFYYDSVTGKIGDFGFFSTGPASKGYSPTDFFFGESINLNYGNPLQNLNLSGWLPSSGVMQTMSPNGSGPMYNLQNHNCQHFCEYARGY